MEKRKEYKVDRKIEGTGEAKTLAGILKNEKMGGRAAYSKPS